MAESALSNFPRVHRAFVDFNKRAANAGSAFCRVRRAFVDLGTVLLSLNVAKLALTLHLPSKVLNVTKPLSNPTAC